jgi:hypothetical protein
MPRAQKGQRFGGRTKGTPNKLPRDIKTRVLAIAEKLEEEGKGLEDEARKDPNWFYTNFLKPMLPKDVSVSGDVGLTVKIIRFTDGHSVTK